MRKKGIAIIGRIARDTELYDGQTVKTRVLYEELQKQYSDRVIYIVDTYQYKKHAAAVLKSTLYALRHSEAVIVMLSRNGRSLFVPVLLFFNLFFRRVYFHDVIGGAFPQELQGHSFLIWCMKHFRETWVETESMKEALGMHGINAVKVLPNFKNLPILKEEELPVKVEKPCVFMTFSRVSEDKGITRAIHAVSRLNRRCGPGTAILHVYGQIEEEYTAVFMQLLMDYPNDVLYMGKADPKESVNILKLGFMLLFPSVYPGEGIPGTVIDAYAAGLPVIATDWHYNGELIRHGRTGYVYSWEKPELLEEYMDYAVHHEEEVYGMRRFCIAEAKKYTPEAVMPYIINKLEELW